MRRKLVVVLAGALLLQMPVWADESTTPEAATDAGSGPVGTPANVTPAVAPAANTKVLPIIGRIEEIASPDSTLPESLTKLQAETPKLDNRPAEPLKINAEYNDTESSPAFPSYIQGRWGGQVNIVTAYVAPGGTVQADIVVGTPGLVIFQFNRDDASVRLSPAAVILPARMKRLADCAFSPTGLANLKQRAAAKGQQIDPNMLIRRSPEIRFGTTHSVKLDGSEYQVELTANSVRVLDDNTVEQDIVTKRHAMLKGGRESFTYDENILQFRKTGDDTEYVRAAKVTYGPDRRIRRSTVVEGPLSRNWQSTAKQISDQLRRPWDSVESSLDL